MMRQIILLIAFALFFAFPISGVVLADDDWDGFRFNLEDLNGDELSEDDVFNDGTIYLVDFWAEYCQPCKKYLPRLKRMVDEYGEQGFQVVIFCIDQASQITTARATLRMGDYPFTFLFDPESEVKDELGVKTIPTSMLFDPTGDELWRHVGFAVGDEFLVAEEIEANLPDDDEAIDEEDENEDVEGDDDDSDEDAEDETVEDISEDD